MQIYNTKDPHNWEVVKAFPEKGIVSEMCSKCETRRIRKYEN
jgi:hypothetical protein